MKEFGPRDHVNRSVYIISWQLFQSIRCNVYPRVPAGCTLVPDPNDPTCCKAPSCPVVQPGATPTPGVVKPLEPAYGTITGNGTPPPEPVPTIMVNGKPQPATGGTNVTPTPQQGIGGPGTLKENNCLTR